MSETKWRSFTDEELRRAMELLISPRWLKERGAMIALLKHFEFTAQDVKEKLDSGVPFNDGPYLNWDY